PQQASKHKRRYRFFMGGLLSIAFLRGWCEGCGNGVPTLQSKTLRERKSSRILLFYQQPPKWQEETKERGEKEMALWKPSKSKGGDRRQGGGLTCVFRKV